MTEQDMTALERAQQTLGKQISLDNFLFSCLEHENLARKSRQDPDHQEWPKLAELDPEQASQLEALLDDLCQWLKENCHQLTFDELIDISKVSYFAPVAVSLAQTLEDVTKRIYPVTPAFDSRKTPNHEFWQVTLKKLKQHFPYQYELLESYLWWTFGPTPIDDIDPSSRPPVGRYAYFGRPRQSSSQRPPAPDRGNRGRPGANGKARDGRKDGPRRGREGPRRAPPQEVEVALRKEVLKAVAKLREDPSTDSVPLAPQNSYHRRLQHQMISEEGFASASTGEGDGRAVCVIRQGNSK